MVTKAYAYVRFSSKPQEEGDSLNRQLKAAREYAKKHDLDLDENTYRDLGVSAFTGANVDEGRLGVFIKEVEARRIPKGSYLLIESFDRLSRNVISEAQMLLLRILNLDINIVTLLDQQVYTKEKYNADNGVSVIVSLGTMIRAHEESKTKSKRVKDGWAAVHSGERGRKIFTRMAPAWLSVENDKWVLNKDHVATVKQIFKLAHKDGFGAPTIAKMLNKAGVKTFRKARDPKVVTEWTTSTVIHVLRNEAVTGVYESERVPRREDYYPVIIKPEVFRETQDVLESRRRAPLRSETGVINLFAGMSFCGLCGSKMKTIKSRNAFQSYLHCDDAYMHRTNCKATRVAYSTFEDQFLKWLLEEGINIFQSESSPVEDPRTAVVFVGSPLMAILTKYALTFIAGQ